MDIQKEQLINEEGLSTQQILISLYLLFHCTLAYFTLGFSQEIPDSLKYLGQSSPGLTPEVFASGIVSVNDRLEFNNVFSPDGREFYFTVSSPSWDKYTIMCMKFDNGKWNGPDTALFCSKAYDDLEPTFSPDGQYIYFTSGRPPSAIWDIWRIKRSESGWEYPEHLEDDPINTIGYENYAFIPKTGTIYFISSRPVTEYKLDIYRSELIDDQYSVVENLGDSINTIYNEFDPYVASDESYIIFSSNRPGGYGKTDMYISYRKEDKTWTKSINMGEKFNTEMGEGAGARITPDGKYFFFTRYGNITSDIYWVDVKALDELLLLTTKAKK
jgi:Tol biopolymer transport system component